MVLPAFLVKHAGRGSRLINPEWHNVHIEAKYLNSPSFLSQYLVTLPFNWFTSNQMLREFVHKLLCNTLDRLTLSLLTRTPLFSSVHKFTIGFRSGLCVGHSSTFTLFSMSHFVCLGLLFCWKTELPLSSTFLADF